MTVDAPIADRRTFGVPAESDLARHTNDSRGILDDQAHPLQQRRGVIHRIRVDTTDVAEPREVDAAVQCIGLASVHFVYHGEPRIAAAPVHGTDGGGRERWSRFWLDNLELEGYGQLGQRAVVGTVVHDDDLLLWIVRRQQRPNGAVKEPFIVEDGG